MTMRTGIRRRRMGKRLAITIATLLVVVAVLSLGVAHTCFPRPALAGVLGQAGGEQTVRFLDGGQVQVTLDFGPVAANSAYVVLRDTENKGGTFAGTPLKVGPQAQTIYEGMLDEMGRDQFTFDMSAELLEFKGIYDYFFQTIVFTEPPSFSNGAELAPWIIEEESPTPTRTPTPTPTRGSAELRIGEEKPEPRFPWWLPILCLLLPLLFTVPWIWKWLRNWLWGPGGPVQPPKPQVPPTIWFTSPKPDQVVLPSNFPITVACIPGASPLGLTPNLSVTGPQGKVRMHVNPLQATADWTRNQPFANGKTTLAAKITDQAGQTAMARVTFYVDGLAPELSLHLNWARKKTQVTKRKGNKTTKSPTPPPTFPHRNLQLSVWIRERPDPPGYAGLDYRQKKVKLTADFPCQGLDPNENLLSIGGPRSRKLFQDLLVLDEPLKDGEHKVALSAADKLGNASTIDLVFTTKDGRKLTVVDKDGEELKAIPLVWREWDDYSPFYFYIVVEDPSVLDSRKELRASLVSKKDIRLYESKSNIVLTRDKSGAPRFRSRPLLVWAEAEFKDKTDLKLALERWVAQNQKDPDRTPILIHGASQGEIKVSAQGREQTLPTPDRRAMILAPALGCPGLAHSKGKVNVILMMRNELESPDKFDVAGALGWCEWSERDAGKVRLVRPTEVTEVKTWRKAGILITHHPSRIVQRSYEQRRYGRRVYASVTAPAGVGLHALLVLHDEGNVLRYALNRLCRPQFPYPGPLCPILPLATKTLGFQPGKTGGSATASGAGKASRLVRPYHPVAVFDKTKQFLNIAHLSDTHIAARWELLEQRWNGKTPPWKPVENKRVKAQDVWRQSVASRGGKPGAFNNPNAQTWRILGSVGKDSKIDVIIITGDLIDYNRGLKWYDPTARGRNDLREDYYYNLNWLCFYEMLLDTYKKPVFTLLGNHDWRLNPYAPLPIITDLKEFFEQAMDKLSEKSWGVKGLGKIVSKLLPTTLLALKAVPELELHAVAAEVNLTSDEVKHLHENAPADVVESLLNEPSSTLYTSEKSVQWYSFVINPFYDYTVRFGHMAFAMLGWAEGEEDVFIDAPDLEIPRLEIAGVRLLDERRLPHGRLWEASLPWAEKTLSRSQQKLLKAWGDKNKKDKVTTAVLCLHAPIFNPFPEVGDVQVNKADGGRARSPRIEHLPRSRDRWRGTLLAPFIEDSEHFYERSKDLVHGTIVEKRTWFIDWVTREKRVQLVLSGHTHRAGVYEVMDNKVRVREPCAFRGKPLREHTVFAVAASSGMIGFRNKHGGKQYRRLVEPAYRHITFDNNGNLLSLDENTVKPIPIREEVRRDYGEAPGDV